MRWYKMAKNDSVRMSSPLILTVTFALVAALAAMGAVNARELVYDNDFVSNCNGWTGGTCTTGSFGGYYGTTSSDVNFNSPDHDLSSYDEFEIVDTIWIGDYAHSSSNLKIVPVSPTSASTVATVPRAIVSNTSSTALKVQNVPREHRAHKRVHVYTRHYIG